jgi:hypothetical protein
LWIVTSSCSCDEIKTVNIDFKLLVWWDRKNSVYWREPVVVMRHSFFYLTRPTVWSQCSQFLSHHNYSLKSLFTAFISSQLQFEVTVHSFFLITTTGWSQYTQFFLSHQTNSLKSMFTVFSILTSTCSRYEKKTVNSDFKL